MLTRREMLVLTGAGTAWAAAALSGRGARAAIAAQTPVNFDVPSGACDCHAHIFPDPARYPFTPNRVELREPVAPMPREKSKWRPPRGERTNAEHRGGPTRTSEEGRSCGRSKGVGPSGCLQRPTGNRRRPWRQRSRRLLGGSGVSREAPAPFCERPEVKLLRPTRLIKRSDTAKGFEVLPRRWVVERTLAWLGR